MKFSKMPYVRPDLAAVTARANDIVEKVKNGKNVDEALALHKKFTELVKDFNTAMSICFIRHTRNTKDSFYSKENDFYDENLPVFSKLRTDFYRAMVNSPLCLKLEESLGELWFINAELELKGFDEKIIDEMQKENALTSKYTKLIASAEMDFNGKKVNLAKLRAFQLSPDREIRRAAYKKRTEFFSVNEKELDDIFDKLVNLRHSMALKLGYKNYVELGYVKMMRNSYTPEDVKRFRDIVKKILVPFLVHLHEQRRKDLEVDKLKFYDDDIYYATGNPNPKVTGEEMFEAGKRMYAELSSQTDEFFGFMVENELFDVSAKEGKAGGGYCIDIPNYKSPFIFANFNGTSEDVDVLTHECGHALMVYLATGIDIYEYSDSTHDVAEIHSMSMEYFTSPWMRLFFKKEAEKFQYMQLASALAFIPYGCMVDEFQYIIYEYPNMTPTMRKETWKKLEKEYLPHLDFDGDSFFGKGGTWQRQAHVFESPFYYIDYCLAQVCAIQYRVWMESDFKAAWESYIELLRKAGTMKFTDLVSEAGLKSPFDPDCIDSIIIGVSKLLKKLKTRAVDKENCCCDE